MNRIDKLMHWTFGFLTARQAKPETRQAEVDRPQPVCRLLDKSADIAEEYAKSSHEGKGRGVCSGERTLTVCERTAPAPNSLAFLDLKCATVVDSNKYGTLECGADAGGICKNCGLPICRNCEKWEYCTEAGRHEVTIQ